MRAAASLRTRCDWCEYARMRQAPRGQLVCGEYQCTRGPGLKPLRVRKARVTILRAPSPESQGLVGTKAVVLDLCSPLPLMPGSLWPLMANESSPTPGRKGTQPYLCYSGETPRQGESKRSAPLLSPPPRGRDVRRPEGAQGVWPAWAGQGKRDSYILFN